eukprot:1605-Heterococcus_DN1.PRE.2
MLAALECSTECRRWHMCRGQAMACAAARFDMYYYCVLLYTLVHSHARCTDSTAHYSSVHA